MTVLRQGQGIGSDEEAANGFQSMRSSLHLDIDESHERDFRVKESINHVPGCPIHDSNRLAAHETVTSAMSCLSFTVFYPARCQETNASQNAPSLTARSAG